MHADYIADSLSSVVSHPVTVQVINQGPGIWGSVATGLITAGAAIAAVMLTHRFTLKREKQTSEDKMHRERYFIATELIFMLERFGEECVPPATDYGDAEDENGYSVSESRIPDISFAGIKGDWRSLPPLVMYRLRELEVMLAESHNIISALFEHDEPPYFSEGFFRRQKQAVRLGIWAFILSAKLRKLCNVPVIRQAENAWSAPRVLRLQYRRHQAICIAARRNGTTLGTEMARSAYYQREGAQ